jgi:hypothetical protein
MLGYRLRMAMGARMGWDEDRWAEVWFCTCDARPLNEDALLREYQQMMSAVVLEVGIAASTKKKKVVRKVEQAKVRK